MGNIFTTDPTVKALWNMDVSPGLLADSIGGNTFTNWGGAPQELVDFKQGDASLDCSANGDSLYINDISLDSGFPLKNGEANPSFSISGWIKPALMDVEDFMAKWATGVNRSFRLFGTGTTLQLHIGTIGATEVFTDTSTTIVVGQWYHVTISWDDSTFAWRIRIYDADADSTAETTGFGVGNNIQIGSARFGIGGNVDTFSFGQSWQDEVVVFDRIITSDEADEIRQGIFGAFSGNDFTGDANCKALWNMDVATGILTDSIGGNTLTDVGNVQQDTVDFQQGDAAADFIPIDGFNVADADLDAGFPFKNGDTTKKISMCFWFKSDLASHNFVTIFSKWRSGKKSWAALVNGNRVTMGIGYNNGITSDWSSVETNTVIQQSQWYHVGITYDDADRSWRIRVWDEDASLVQETTGTAPQNINIEDSHIDIGSITGGSNWDGLIDELVVFNDILTADEIDEIRQGIYGAGPGPGADAKCLNVVYVTDTTGFLWYAEAAAPFADDVVISEPGGGEVTVNGESVIDPTFYPQGEVIVLTGDNAGERRPVLRDTTDTVTLMWPFPNELQEGDAYTITPGCNKTTDHCDFKFDNAPKFRGFKYIPRIEESIT